MVNLRLGACILAAGFSSRMGTFKPLLPLNDELVIERVIRVSKDVGIKDIVVVTGHNREALFPIIQREKVKEAFNPQFDQGMFTSIQTGTAALPRQLDGFFLMPVDCPLLIPEVLLSLAENFETHQFIVPCYKGKKGHPLLIPSAYREEIIKHNGKGGLKAITDRDFSKMKRISVEHEGVVMDMDHPQAYEEVKAYLERGCQSESLEELAKGRRFFLIRHGQIRQHQEKIFLGQTDIPLSPKGKEQAERAGTVLSGFFPDTDTLYSSDLKRAWQTGRIIQERTGISRLTAEPGLREMNLGPWDGKFISQIKKEFPKEYEKRGKHLWTYKMGHGSENFFDLQYRVIKTLKKILKNDKKRDIILVAHSGVLRAVSNNLKGKDVSHDWQPIKNGEMEIIEN